MTGQRKGRRARWLEPELALVETMLKERWTHRAIADSFGVTPAAIQHLIGRHDRLQAARHVADEAKEAEIEAVSQPVEDPQDAGPQPYWTPCGGYVVAEGKMITPAGIPLPYISILDRPAAR